MHVCGTFFWYEYVHNVYCNTIIFSIFVFPVFLGSLFVLAAKQARILGAEATPNRSEWQDIGQAWLVQVDAHTGLVLQFRFEARFCESSTERDNIAFSDARSLKV